MYRYQLLFPDLIARPTISGMYLSDIGNVHKMLTSKSKAQEQPIPIANQQRWYRATAFKYLNLINKSTLEIISNHESFNARTINSFKSLEIQIKYFFGWKVISIGHRFQLN